MSERTTAPISRSTSRQWVSCADLQRQAARAGLHHSVLRPQAGEPEALLAGRFELHPLRPGLTLKLADTQDLHDLHCEAEVEPGLNLVLLLSGRAEAHYGKRRLCLQGGAQALLLALAEPERFVRRARRGQRQCKLVLSLGRDWLDASGLDDGPLQRWRRTHLNLASWQPSPQALSLAAQMFSPPPYASAPLQRLYQESRALELAAEALAQLGTAPSPAPAGLGTRRHARMLAFRAWLDSGAAEACSLEQMARHAGINARSLQQQFRAAFGSSVFDYLRGQRLDAARAALETQGLSVTQAAHLAGYGSAANFATACKRRYGLSPSALRRR